MRSACAAASALTLLLVFTAPVMSQAAESSSDAAAALALAGQFEEALAVYADVLAREPGQREALLGRARVLGWHERYDEALVTLDGLLAEDPDDVEVLVLRARVLGWMHRNADAEADARRALAVAPESVEAHVVLGDLLTWTQRVPEASAAYSAALRIEPESRAAQEGLRRLGGGNMPGEASPYARRMRVDVGGRFDSVEGDASDWWQEDLHVAVQALPQLRVYAGLTQTRRFQNDDTQGSMALSWAPGEGWWLGAGATFGPGADVVARYAFSFEFARRVAERATAQLHYRRSWYAGDVETDAISPGIELWPAAGVKLLARYHFTHVTGGRLGHAGSLRAELFPESRLVPFVSGLFGSEAFAPSTVQGARTEARATSVSAGIVWKLRPGMGVRLGYAFNDLKDTQRRHGLETGLFVEF